MVVALQAERSVIEKKKPDIKQIGCGLKVEHVKQPGLLQSLPVANQAWKTVCMDFYQNLINLTLFWW